MKTPENFEDVRQFLGMANHMSKFFFSSSYNKTKPLKDLLSKNQSWTWSFQALKEDLNTDQVVALYNPDAETVASVDASSYGLGAVLKNRSHQKN